MPLPDEDKILKGTTKFDELIAAILADADFLAGLPAAVVDAADVVDDIVADPTALSALGEGLGVTELVAGLNALLLYLDIDPGVLVDNDGNPLTDTNGNLIIG